MQYARGETKRHLSHRFGEHRRAIEKAIQRHHINQPTAVSDHFSLPGHSINNIELIPSAVLSEITLSPNTKANYRNTFSLLQN